MTAAARVLAQEAGSDAGGGQSLLRLRLAARAASPAVAAEVAHRFLVRLGEALSAGCAARPGETQVPADQALLLSVRRDGASGDQDRWVIQYSGQDGDGVSGRVLTLGPSDETPPGCERVEVSSYQDLLDLAAGRASPAVALARRRVSVTRGALGALRSLRPAILSAAIASAEELQALSPREPPRGSPRAEVWMPDSACGHCPLCSRPWHALLRRRHHCRSCGTLACGSCSAARSSADHLRQCLRCAEGRPPLWQPPPAGGAAPAAAPAAPSETPAADPEGHPQLPPRAQELGVLLAQVDEALAERVAGRVPAMPPSRRERMLWDRLVAAEERAGARGGLPVICGGLVPHAVHALLCAAAAFLALARPEHVPGPILGAGTFAAERVPRLSAWAFLAALCGLTLAALLTARAVTRLAAAVLLAWTLGQWYTLPAGFALESPVADQHPGAAESLLAAAVAATPCWALVCTVASLALLASRSLRRVIEIYLTAAIPISLYWSAAKLVRILRLSDDTATQVVYSELDRLVAPYLTERFLSLGGLFVKLGQWMASMSTGVPVVWQKQLSRLTDSTPADSEAHVRTTVEQEFGRPLEELFSSFDTAPIASASIAQVHRAVQRSGDGRPVAVKLQHSGVEESMRSDLKALRKVVRFSTWLGGEAYMSLKDMFESWTRDMLKELDFQHEVENLRKVRTGLVAAGVDVVVPEEVDGLVATRAFAMTFIDGFRMSDLDRLVLHGVDRDALGARTLHAAACQMLEIGVLNSDPHSGNVLCQLCGASAGGPTSALPVLLDFGNCIHLEEAKRLAWCRLILALCEASVTKAIEALGQLGLETNQSKAHPERDVEFMLYFFRSTGSREHQKNGQKELYDKRRAQREADMAELGATTKAEKKKAKAQARRFPKSLPEDYLLIVRMITLVRGLCTQLDVELPLLQIFEYHARRALLSRCPPAERARSLLPPATPPPGRAAPAAEHQQLVGRLRAALARCCAERPGLGAQVCVCVGDECVLDECGGVLSPVDPRPMARDTPVPLAELSRLPLLLALAAEVRAGRASYGAGLAGLLGGERCAGAGPLQLRHALAHRALQAPPGAGRAALALASAADLQDPGKVRAMVSGALAAAPLGEDEAAFLPLGAGCAAAAALEGAGGGGPGHWARQLPGLAGLGPAELAFGAPPDAAAPAALSSALFADFRRMFGGQGAFDGGGGGLALGGPAPAAAQQHSGRQAAAPDPAPAAAPTPAGQSAGDPASKESSRGGGGGGGAKLALGGLGGILEACGGLLVDPALAASAVRAGGCPDLGGAGSARALAAVMAAARPAADARPAFARERGSAGAELTAWLGLAPRVWDERGLEVFCAEDGGGPAAVGLTSGGSLMGMAVQWCKPQGARMSSRGLVTAVVLTNELSAAAVPARLMAEVSSSLGLPIVPGAA